MPSLPAMIHLEKEVKQLNGKVNEFTNSDDYINGLFDNFDTTSKAEKDKNINERNLDVLLGTQAWRKGVTGDANQI